MVGSLGTLAFKIIAQDETAEGTEKASANFTKAAVAIGSAMAAIGGASLKFIDYSKEMNANYNVLSVQTGIAADEFRNLALETADVSFPLESVNSTFDLLVRSGLKTKEEIQATANAFDNLADATGSDAAIVAQQLIPAFNAFGIPLQNAGQYTDQLTYLMRNTTITMEDFSSTIDKLAPDMSTLGLSMDQTVAILKAMSDKGIQGAAATREFRAAVSAADGDINLLLESLGLTADQLKPYQEEISKSTGLTDKFAEAANTEFSLLDKLKAGWSELQLRIGDSLEPMENAFGAMTAIGSIMAGLAPTMTMFSGVQWGTLIPTLWGHATAAWAAVAPYLAILAPILLVIGVLYILEKKFGLVTKTIKILSDGFKVLVSWFKDLPNGFNNVIKIFDTLKNAFDQVINFIKNLMPVFKEAGKNILKNLIDGIITLINKPYDLIFAALKKIRNLLPFSPAKEGPLSKPVSWESYLVDPLEKLNPKLKTSLSNGLTVNSAIPAANSNTGNTFVEINVGPVTISKTEDIYKLAEAIKSVFQEEQVRKGVRSV